MKRIMNIIMIGTALWGCSGAGTNSSVTPPPSGPIGGKGFTLVSVSTPEEINNAMRTVVMNQNDQQMEQLKTSCDSGAQVAYASPAAGGTSASSFTSTNIQEAGVDEADLIKTDGQYVYAVAGNKLRIAKVWPASEFKSMSELSLTGTPEGIILSDTMVIVFARSSAQAPSSAKNYICVNSGCDWGDSNTTVTVVDVKDAVHPKVIKESTYEGSLISQRRIGSKVYVVTSNVLPLPNDLGLVSAPYSDWPKCDANGKPTNAGAWVAKIDGVKKQNADIIAKADFSSLVPKASSQVTARFYADPNASTLSIVSLVTLDMQALTQPDDVIMVMGGANTVYASDKSLYTAQSNYYGDDSTTIHRFSLDTKTDYAGSAQVDGHLINEFALSEYNNVLRVATTTGQVSHDPNNPVNSSVYTLDAASRELMLLGKITGIGKGEQIYSVRFVGPRGFVVTFKKIDPLFVLNLRDPKNISIMGELKMPGFSTYLHPLDENHIIGLGKDAQDMGDFAWYQGLKLSIFDVSDSKSPEESQSLVVGGRYSDSEALHEQHAFTFDASRQLLAIPVTLYAKSDAGGSSSGAYQYSGLQLYRVTVEKGFELLGVVKTSNDSQNNYGYGYSLNDIRRSIVIGDAQQSALITLQNNGLTLHKLDDQLSTLGSVSWSDVASAQQAILY